MKRTLALLLLLAAVPTFAETVTVHFDLSDSVRAALARGEIKEVIVQGVGKAIQTKDANFAAGDLVPGTYKLCALLRTDKIIYVVDPKGVQVEVAAGQPTDVTLPVRSLWVSGTVTQHGAPAIGQMEVWPSKRVPGESWGFAVPVDDAGRFACPLPRAGEYDLRVWWDHGKQHTALPKVSLGDTEAHIELP